MAPFLILALGVVLRAGMGAAVAATVLPPDPSATVGKVIPFDGFVDQDERPRNLDDADRRPWIVLPIYTRCPTTCMALTAGLRAALHASGLGPDAYRVASISFDPHETAASLVEFRQRMQLPSSWLTLRAADPAALERTLRSLDFHTIALDDGGFAHPNLVAVLDGDRRLVTYVYGVQPSPAELARGVERARHGASALDRWRPFLFLFAALGVLASSAALIGVWTRIWRRAPRGGAVSAGPSGVQRP